MHVIRPLGHPSPSQNGMPPILPQRSLPLQGLVIALPLSLALWAALLVPLLG